MIKIALQTINDPAEKLFLKNFSEYMYKAELQNRPFFTEFYNKEWMETVLKKHTGQEALQMVYYFGGYEEAERQLIGICPYEIDRSEWPIGCLEIKVRTGPGKALTHRDFLGALLGLGIERDAIGDIMLKPFGAYVILKESLLDYIRLSLVSVGRYQQIEINEISFSMMKIEAPSTKEISITLGSLRMDAVLAGGFGISRSIAVKLIQAEKAKCNGVVVSASYKLKEGDSITLRGYGKMRLISIDGLTKKDRLRITIEKYI